MHRRQVVVCSDGLQQRVVVPVLPLEGFSEADERLLAFFTTLRATMPRDAEVDVLVPAPEFSRGQ